MDVALLLALGLLAQVRRLAARGPLPPALSDGVTVGRARDHWPWSPGGCLVGSAVQGALCPKGL